MSKKILRMVANSKMTPKEASKVLSNLPLNKGKYLKLRINIKGRKFISKFVNALFFFPIPLWIAKPFLIGVFKEHNIPVDLYYTIKNYSGGMQVLIKNAEVKFRAKII